MIGVCLDKIASGINYFLCYLAPSQAEDDVIELWSCLGNAKVDAKDNKTCPKDCNRNVVNKRFNFVIDTTPSMKNLEYLNREAEPVPKKRRKCNHSDVPALPLSESTTQMLQHSKKGQDRKQHEKRDESQKKKREDKNEKRKRNKSQERRENEGQYKINANSSSACSATKLSKGISNNIELTRVDGNVKSTTNSERKLREIIVDGCNVAMMYDCIFLLLRIYRTESFHGGVS